SYDYAPSIFRYDVKRAKSEVWAKSKVPFDHAAFEIQQVWYQSKDKTLVPMFLFHNKGLKMEGSNPVLLTGYGGFDVSETPNYWPLALVWAEHGGILADANLRGGGEFGEDWHRAGMLGKKQTVFDDFIAAAEYLIANKYTTSSNLAIDGTSNPPLLQVARFCCSTTRSPATPAEDPSTSRSRKILTFSASCSGSSVSPRTEVPKKVDLRHTANLTLSAAAGPCSET